MHENRRLGRVAGLRCREGAALRRGERDVPIDLGPPSLASERDRRDRDPGQTDGFSMTIRLMTGILPGWPARPVTGVFHRASCPLLLSKARVVTAVLSAAVVVDLAVQALGGPEVNLVLGFSLPVLGIVGTIVLSVVQRRIHRR